MHTIYQKIKAIAVATALFMASSCQKTTQDRVITVRFRNAPTPFVLTYSASRGQITQKIDSSYSFTYRVPVDRSVIIEMEASDSNILILASQSHPSVYNFASKRGKMRLSVSN